MGEPVTKVDLQDLKDGTKADVQELVKSIAKRFDNIDERLNNQDMRTDNRFDKIETRDSIQWKNVSDHIERNFNTVVQFATKFDKNKKQNEAIQKRLERHSEEIVDLRERKYQTATPAGKPPTADLGKTKPHHIPNPSH